MSPGVPCYSSQIPTTNLIHPDPANMSIPLISTPPSESFTLFSQDPRCISPNPPSSLSIQSYPAYITYRIGNLLMKAMRCYSLSKFLLRMVKRYILSNLSPSEVSYRSFRQNAAAGGPRGNEGYLLDEVIDFCSPSRNSTSQHASAGEHGSSRLCSCSQNARKANQRPEPSCSAEASECTHPRVTKSACQTFNSLACVYQPMPDVYPGQADVC